VQVGVVVITPPTRAMDRIMEATAAAPIMALRVQLRSQLATARTIVAAPDTGMEARITSGDQVTGRTGTAGKSGFTAITSCVDTNAACCLAVQSGQ
jgi:hypothetical protein